MHIQKHIILFRGRSRVFILHFVWPISCKGMQSCFTLAWFIPDWMATWQRWRESSSSGLCSCAPSGSYESGVAQIVDEDLVDEAVLSEGLDHHHPLSAELQQDVRDVQRLQQDIASESTPSGWWGAAIYSESNPPRCAPGRR